jgi:hypothetical protein
MYPSIAVVNNLYPEHLGREFCEVYSDILQQRIAAKKAGNMSISDAFKLALNSVYGKSNDVNSFLYDPMYTMKTTVNGQLMLTMLAEELVDTIDGLQMLQINTDGLTVKIHRDWINVYHEICKDWEKATKLNLEFVEYKKMVIRDVNNYLAVKLDGKVKYKGAFEIDKELHKDNSFKVIPYALSQYFVKGIPIEETILNHRKIYDFCGRQKFTSDSYGIAYRLEDGKIKQIKQQKNVRYYVSTNGDRLIKHYNKGDSEVVHKGYVVTVFNDYVEKNWDDYKINYSFYIKECKKEINSIDNGQMTLFND